MVMKEKIHIRKGVRRDIASIYQLIRELAVYERAEEEGQTNVVQMEEEGFGDCSNYAECEAACPVGISISAIAQMRRDYAKAVLSSE